MTRAARAQIDTVTRSPWFSFALRFPHDVALLLHANLTPELGLHARTSWKIRSVLQVYQPFTTCVGCIHKQWETRLLWAEPTLRSCEGVRFLSGASDAVH